MAAPELLVEEDGAVQTVTLNRPDKLNAITPGMIGRLREAVQDYARRPDLRCFLIRAQGRYFTAGADLLAGGAEGPLGDDPASIRLWYRTAMGGGMQPLYAEMEAVEKPFVAAHQATCVGGGLEISLSCDFRIAARSARYVLPEAKLGAIPASNGVSRLTHLIGPHWAKYLIMANKPINAERALAVGLIHELYDDADFEEQVTAFCRHIAAQPPQMVATAKLAIDLAANATPDDAKRIERLAQAGLHGGAEAAALIAAMRDRLAGAKPK